MSNTIYLYLKTHNKTGLKYLGKTVKDPFKYRGSGIRWTNHIQKHGYDVTTKILFESDNPEEIKQKGIHYSNLWDVVNSDNFANLISEQGQGGDTLTEIGYKHSDEIKQIIKEKRSKQIYNEEHRRKLSENRTGRTHSDETKTKMKNTWKIKKENGYIRKHPSSSEEHKRKIRESKWRLEKRQICEYCNKCVDNANYKRWHGNKCKEKKKK